MYRNRKLLDILRESPCQECGRKDGTIVAAHSNQLRDGKGRGIKAHDYRVAALCYSCHMEIDQGKSLSKAERIEIWEEAHRKTISWLFENEHITVTS
jgi:ferredoxin